jgi:catechol-2,3-dioxygenase
MTSTPLRNLGHVVLNVRSLPVSTRFYCEALSLTEVGRNAERGLVFLSFGVNDHDIALREVEPTAAGHDESAVGLRHVAFRIGAALADLRAFMAHLDARQIPIRRVQEHLVSTSIYFSDPDGIELEGYVEHSPEVPRREPATARFSRPARID